MDYFAVSAIVTTLLGLVLASLGDKGMASVINTPTNQVVANTAGGGVKAPFGITYDSYDSYVYVANLCSGYLLLTPQLTKL